MIPLWLHLLSWAALLLGGGCAAFIAADVMRHPQKMAVMNVVWPTTALFGSVLTLWAYRRYGRLKSKDAGDKDPDIAFPIIVAKGALHCGSGCMIGDILAETLGFVIPPVLVAFGWHWLFDEKIFATWGLDFVFAFALGIVFQYFAIVPMRKLPLWAGLSAAFKADTLSLCAWQVGMYGFMAVAQFLLFRPLLHVRLEPNSAEFWFVMQIAMCAGFATAYPVNWWLISAGIKEKM